MLEVSGGGTTSPSPTRLQGYGFEALFDTWLAAKRPRILQPASIAKFRHRVRDFRAFIGHDDPRKVTEGDAQRYLAYLEARMHKGRPPSAKHLRDAIANMSAVLRPSDWKARTRGNPFLRTVPRKAPKTLRTKRKAFTDEEASAILRKARLEADPFRRWGPWLMAYSGMRLTEAGQLRVVDIERESDGGFIVITPEAGHVKSGDERIVPLHAAVVAEGFLEFVRGVEHERLFPGACLTQSGQRISGSGLFADHGAHKLSEWVRHDVGITRKEVSPNHGWRHWFEWKALNVGMDTFARRRITGRSGSATQGSEADYQNDQFRQLLKREMAKFPSILLR